MKKLLRRRWLIGAALVLAVLAGGYVLVPVGEGRISQANCDRIRLRMTFGEVSDLLSERGTSGAFLGPVSMWFWSDEDGNQIAVLIDEQGVISKTFVATDLPFQEQLNRRIQRRLRALWATAQRPGS
jgi:hypothetical protein